MTKITDNEYNQGIMDMHSLADKHRRIVRKEKLKAELLLAVAESAEAIGIYGLNPHGEAALRKLQHVIGELKK